jgi:hypothetical protein
MISVFGKQWLDCRVFQREPRRSKGAVSGIRLPVRAPTPLALFGDGAAQTPKWKEEALK